MSSVLKIAVEWLEADEVRTPELAATWCRLEMNVDGLAVTAVDDERTRSPRRGIYCSAYSLAEWIATSWWGLRSHVPRGNEREARHRSWHDARAASDGFTWPRLTINPAGALTHVLWQADVVPRGVIRYLSAGEAWIPSDEAQRELATFVDGVVDKLAAAGIDDSLLQNEWHAIRAADREEAAVCDTAAALGLDPFDLDAEHEERLAGLQAVLGGQLAVELANVSSPERLDRDTRWATRSLTALGKVSVASTALSDLSPMFGEAITTSRDRPWEVGWHRARAMRHTLGWAADTRADLAAFVHEHRTVKADNDGLFGVAGMQRDGVHLVPAGAGVASRFTAARALHGSVTTPERPVLITAARTHEAAVERAFAAELLAPRDGLRALVGEKYVVRESDVQGLVRHFGAPAAAIRHQLSNQLDLEVV